MAVDDDLTFVVITEAEFEAARTRALNELGVTWAELESYVDDCRCCLTTPPEVNESRAQQIWMTFHNE